MFDDGFIYVRIVGQLSSGAGPVFNAGQRVETYTSPMWVAVLWLGNLVTPLSSEWVAVLVGLAMTTAGVAVATIAGTRLVRSVDSDAFLLPVGTAVFVAIVPTWVWATSGLETGLVFLWLGVVWWLLVDWATTGVGRVAPWQAVVLGLGWLIRPELVLVSAAVFVVLVAVTWRSGQRRAAVATAAAMVALPLAYQVFRMGYFGLMVANTAMAKEGGASNWSRGWTYLRDLVDQYWLWLPLLGLAAGVVGPVVATLVSRGMRRAVVVVGLFGGLGVLLAVYVVRVGGDYLHGRMLLPSLFMICSAAAVVPVRRRNLAAAVILPWILVVAVAVRPAQFDGFVVNGTVLGLRAGKVTVAHIGPPVIDDEPPSGVYREVGLLVFQRVDDLTLRDGVTEPLLLSGAIGLVSVAFPDARIFDLFGLADPLGSHLEIDPTRFAVAGHEKYQTPAWVAAQLAAPGTPVQPIDVSVLLDVPQPDPGFADTVDVARSVLACGPVQRRLAAATAPLTARQFVANVVRSVGNSRLRIPLDPTEARRALCDDDQP